jgi:phytoene desaturase
MAAKAIIVGAGIGGIATAIRLAVKGYEVTVFEQNSYPGGKLSQLLVGDYRFDAGPSLFTMPQLVEELFELAGEDSNTHFKFVRKDTACVYFWDDGTVFRAPSDAKAFARQAASTFNTDQVAILDHLQWAEKTYHRVGRIFLEKPLHKPSTWLNWNVAKALMRLPSYKLSSTMHRAHIAALGDPKLVQLFDRYATYNGSNPYKSPGLLSMIPHLEYGIGTYFPKGGMHHITESLFNLAKRVGVKFEFDAEVNQICVSDGFVRGVQVANEQIDADIVVSNMDVSLTYSKLLTSLPRPERTLRQERSSSAIIFYWGMKHDYPTLDLHNIFFSNDYQAEFEHLFGTKTMYHDPTVYVNISSKDCPDDAPDGHSNWFVLVNAPHNTGQNWDEHIAHTRERVFAKLSRVLKREIAKDVVEEAVLDPRTIESKTGSLAGSLYGTSSNSKWSAFLRHRNQHKRIRNLYFVGGSVHPGGGIPLCLNSARIVANLVPS